MLSITEWLTSLILKLALKLKQKEQWTLLSPNTEVLAVYVLEMFMS